MGVWKTHYARDCYLPLLSHSSLGLYSDQWAQVKNKQTNKHASEQTAFTLVRDDKWNASKHSWVGVPGMPAQRRTGSWYGPLLFFLPRLSSHWLELGCDGGSSSSHLEPRAILTKSWTWGMMRSHFNCTGLSANPHVNVRILVIILGPCTTPSSGVACPLHFKSNALGLTSAKYLRLHMCYWREIILVHFLGSLL